MASDKVCPLSGMECLDNCAWNTGKGCAVALLPRKLEDLGYEIKTSADDMAKAIDER